MTTKEMRELDAWIAEHVMNEKPRYEARALNAEETEMALWESDLITRGMVREFCAKHPEYHYKDCPVYARYTTDPAAAMGVLEKCAEKVRTNQGISVVKPRGFVVALSTSVDYEPDDYSCHSVAETLPLAICLFARKLFENHEQ